MRLPPLNSLRAFEAAARHSSVAKAAKELHVTPAAISHQIKMLESHLGVSLFKRMPRKIQLTPAGQACLPKLSAAFALMADAVSAVEQQRGTSEVVVSVPPALGTKWLVGKLPSFTAAHPEVELRIAVRQSMVDKALDSEHAESSVLEDADIAIRLGDGDYEGLVVHELFRPTALPMCSPKLMRGPHPLNQPEDLVHHTLLHYQSDLASLDVGRPTWSSWLREAGVRDIKVGKGITFNHVVTAMEAAADGIGVILGIPIVASADIAAGRLVMPFSMGLAMGTAYYAVCRPASLRNPGVVAFRDWLITEASKEPWHTAPTPLMANDAN